MSLAQNEEELDSGDADRLPSGSRTATLTPTPPSRAKARSGY